MMTGDTRVNKHRTANDLLLELKRRTPLMQDKAVQSSYDNLTMDESSAAYDNHLSTSRDDMVTSRDDNVSSMTSRDDIVSSMTSRNDNMSSMTSRNDIMSSVPSVTVAEINSPTTDSNGPSSPIYSKPFQRGGTSLSEDSGLVDDGFGGTLDGVDSATLELRPKHFLGSSKKDADDEIKEQSPPSLISNNCLYKEQKLKEQFETKEDSNTNNCALECLAFTLECCQCVIL
ncbi:uncharacterized protein LOC111061256 isoform X2 [Nilaparvata lugens]|nr:uncharacterized protein LOC111061256 isoform X2 [Nilaparvata lugens]XP_039286113.1 uncharacterized protein LOC111061256 isoform X2 [Nilaparvata lugens]